jgi:nucleoside-diphosphate-sugar epimerase
MKNVLITGSKGHIGKILTAGLSDGYYKLRLADLPSVDLTNYKQALKASSNIDVIVHLAWKSQTENCFNDFVDPDNSLMFRNIYKAALEAKVPRVIIASSVHADDFRNREETLINPLRTPTPTTPYGADKVFMESLGRYYSKKGLEVACVRFGAVGSTPANPPKDAEGQILWLTSSDCISLVKTIINAKEIPGNFALLYGVSNNKDRVHDLSNPFNWKPKEGFGL